MGKFDCILFDLDGTLIDTTPLIFESFRHTFLYHFNEKKEDSELLAFLGIPLKNAFESTYPDFTEILLKTYKEFNESKHDRYVGIFINIVDMLEKLAAGNILLGVVTSKRRELAMRGMKLFGIDKYMSVFVGMEDTARHKPEGDPIIKALAQMEITDKSRVLYVGDSPYDILSAKNAGVKSAVVGWSYLPQHELTGLNPDICLKEPKDLLKFI